MPTTIKALATFANDEHLSHLNGAVLQKGRTTEVADRYAREVVSKGLAVEVDSLDEEDRSVTVEADDSAGPWSLGESVGGGYYRALYDGEPVESEQSSSGYLNVGRGDEEARAEIDELNEEGATPDDVNA